MQTFVFANPQVQHDYNGLKPSQPSLVGEKTLDQTTFEKLLSDRLHPDDHLLTQWGHVPQSVRKQLTEMFASNHLNDDELQQQIALLDLEQLSFLEEITGAEEKLTKDLEQWIMAIFNQQQIEDHFSGLDIDSLKLQANQLEHVQQDESQIINQLHQILSEVQTLLTNISSEADTLKIAPKILALLEAWTTISNDGNQLSQSLTSQDEENINEVWRELLQTYEKRATLNTKQRYQTEAEVTAKDVAKWLNQFIVKQTQSIEPSRSLHHMSGITTAVSNIEHYMIHVHQMNAQPAETQIIEQFQQIIRTSQLFTNPSGHQLVITLQPENLGDLVVRLTEINGELTLKIITSSQVTRQMLEANIHELRNMFAPHQVTIERQDLELNQVQQQLEDEFVHEQEQDQSENDQEQENEPDHNKFTEALTSLLMNEKV